MQTVGPLQLSEVIITSRAKIYSYNWVRDPIPSRVYAHSIVLVWLVWVSSVKVKLNWFLETSITIKFMLLIITFKKCWIVCTCRLTGKTLFQNNGFIYIMLWCLIITFAHAAESHHTTAQSICFNPLIKN